jgi:MFS family permease
VKEIYYARKDSRVFYAILTLACSLLNIAGAIVADTMARKSIPLRVTAAVGTLLTAPILFLHWWLMGQVAKKTYTETTGEYVIACLCGMIESLGTGMVLTAAYSYICKQATGLASGRKFGSLQLVITCGGIVNMLWVYLWTDSTYYYALWGGIFCLLIVAAWFFMPELNQISMQHGPLTETKRFG